MIASRLIAIASCGMILLSLFILGCGKHEAVKSRTLSSNAYEKDLQRIVLPSVAKFDGGIANPISLFSWLKHEAVRCDPAETKVQFVIQISSNDVPPLDSGVQTHFNYLSSSATARIMLPDAVKFYAGICGLSFEFKKNLVTIRSVDEK